jgi:protein O-GlcNAcase / histone acetyltransferase
LLTQVRIFNTEKVGRNNCLRNVTNLRKEAKRRSEKKIGTAVKIGTTLAKPYSSRRRMIPDCFGPADDVAVIGPNAPTSVKENGFICGVVEGFYGRPWTADQRQKLFKRMNKMGLNTYLYAPKDDSKHRVYWRDLYTVEEADLLTTLIESAEEAGVTFVYAISPGLDITYSSSKEVGCLKRKLSQVASFGCKAFALLFDDIETELCEADKGAFQSFASAHVSVTNEVYHHLHKPSHFSFCPTEYCASRAVPTVLQSEYLNTVGTKLHPNIDVMWTGPKVISKKISIKSIEEVTKAIRRPPLIWDNIHANDYDHKRIFLGPYDGRSPELVSYIRGVLTNPNCEFEANYIALHASRGRLERARAHTIPKPPNGQSRKADVGRSR